MKRIRALGYPHAHAPTRKRRLTSIVLSLLCLTLLCTIRTARAQSPDASSSAGASSSDQVMEQVFRQNFSRHGFEMKIQFQRDDPHFLENFLAPFERNGLQFAMMEGRVVWTDTAGFDIYLHPRADTQMESHFHSDDGFNIAYVPTEGFTPGPATASTTAPASPAARDSGSPDAASPSPFGATPAPVPAETTPASGAAGTLYKYHPLTMLWPFNLKKTSTTATYEFDSVKEEQIVGKDCWRIIRKGDVTMTLWIDKSNNAIVQIEYVDPVTARTDRFNASAPAMIAADPKDPNQKPMWVYSTATISSQGTPLGSITSLEAPTEITPTASPSLVPIGSQAPAPGHHATQPEPPIFGTFMKLILLALFIGLAWFGGRYFIFLVSRAVFDKDLIVVDGDGALTRSLQGLGYSITPANMEVLTEERNRLGKKPGAVLPRAVVVAPHSIALAKNYLFLLKAYVEEGGRVMLFNHNAADLPNLPFHAYLVPSAGDRVQLHAAPKMWKRLREEDVETKTGHLLPKEYIVEVDHKRPEVDIVHAVNRSTGIRSTAVGVAKSGKGEFMVCQFLLVDDLKKGKLATSPITKLMMLDLIDYLQGRTGEKSAEGGSTPTA